MKKLGNAYHLMINFHVTLQECLNTCANYITIIAFIRIKDVNLRIVTLIREQKIVMIPNYTLLKATC